MRISSWKDTIPGRTLPESFCITLVKPTLLKNMLSIIVAINQNRGIGHENKLLYWLPNDLKRFKALTTGHTIIMDGNVESLPKGCVLPNRRNIVLSRSCREFEGAECFHTLEEALKACANEEEVFIIGGASLYAEALPHADRLYVTEVEDRLAEADASSLLWTRHNGKKKVENVIRRTKNISTLIPL